MPLVCLVHVVFFPVAYPVSKILDWTIGSHPGITLRSRKAKIEEVILLSFFPPLTPFLCFFYLLSPCLACFSLSSYTSLPFSSSDFSFISSIYFLILLIIIIIIIIIIVIVVLNIVCLSTPPGPGSGYQT